MRQFLARARRNGAVVGFEPAKISIAMPKAFLAINGGQGAASARVRDEVAKLTDAVVEDRERIARDLHEVRELLEAQQAA